MITDQEANRIAVGAARYYKDAYRMSAYEFEELVMAKDLPDQENILEAFEYIVAHNRLEHVLMWVWTYTRR